jgi:hypothetical protein
VYPVIVEPFAEVPLNVTVAFESPAVAETVLGADAAPCVVNAVDTAALAESPTALVATTLYVYEVPSTKPVQI